MNVFFIFFFISTTFANLNIVSEKDINNYETVGTFNTWTITECQLKCDGNEHCDLIGFTRLQNDTIACLHLRQWRKNSIVPRESGEKVTVMKEVSNYSNYTRMCIMQNGMYTHTL